MSLESRRHDDVRAVPRSSPKLDPVKLRMVSDYLKRTISERPYAYILESLTERLEMDQIDRNLTSVGIVPVPPDFDITLLADEKSVAFVPYCSKPFDCPLNMDNGRKSNKCQAMEGQCEHTSCTLSKFMVVAKELGVKEFHVIESDGKLFEWLAQKKDEGFNHIIGVACEYAVSYALEIIHGQLGFDGLIVTINGDKCKTKEEYSESDAADRDRLTFIDDWTLSTLHELGEKSKQSKSRSRDRRE